MDRDNKSFNSALNYHLDPDQQWPDYGEEQLELLIDTISRERIYQDTQAGRKGWKRNKTAAEWILIMEQELAEAKLGYIKNGFGRDSVAHEILQVVAVGVAYLETLSKEDLESLGDFSKVVPA